MKNTITLDDFIFEAELTIHADERIEQRVLDAKLLNTNLPVSSEIAEQYLTILKNNLLSKLNNFARPIDNTVYVIDFGSIVFKKDDKTYIPDFLSVDNKNGNKWCAIYSNRKVITVILFPYDITIEDLLHRSKEHEKRKGNISDNYEHVYLNKKENVIDLNLSVEDYEKKLNNKGTFIPLKNEVSKEQVLNLGAKLYFKDDKGNIISKKVHKAKLDQRTNTIIVDFIGGGQYKIIKGKKGLVYPKNVTVHDKEKREYLGVDIEGDLIYSGEIFTTAQYSKEKMKSVEPVPYFKIMATSVISVNDI